MSATLVVVVLLVVLAAGTALFLFLRSRGKRAPQADAYLRSLSNLLRVNEDRQAERLQDAERRALRRV